MTRLLAAILALLPTLATAQTSCGARETVIEQLQTKYKEALNAAGLQTANSLIEIWASAETGSWTILSTNQSGLSCILSSGQAFVIVALPIPGEDG